jgi:uncharacterized membrane protein YdjX (TVP38/TMEM64 family)
MKQANRIRWAKLSFVVLAFAILSLGIAYLVQSYAGRLHLPLYGSAQLAYLTIFGIAVVINLSFVPLLFAISVMIAAATQWNPVLVALVGSLRACVGELSSYYVGIVGKKIAIPEDVPGYQAIWRWIRRYGLWAIALLSFQPILPIEIGGFVAGATRMPVGRFFLALWLGKFPKYIILIYAGGSLMRLLPFPH